MVLVLYSHMKIYSEHRSVLDESTFGYWTKLHNKKIDPRVRSPFSQKRPAPLVLTAIAIDIRNAAQPDL